MALGPLGTVVAVMASMESTKSQLVLRSMDMDGRSLGTERSSTFQDGRTQRTVKSTVQGALGGNDRFATMLANRTEYGAASEVAGDISARIREGRTDAAEATYNSRGAKAEAWQPREERSVPSDQVPGQEPGAGAAASKDSTEHASEHDGLDEPGSNGDQEPQAQPDDRSDADSSAAKSDEPEADASDVQGQAAPHSVPLAAAGPMGASARQGAATTAPVAIAAPMLNTVAAQATAKAAGARVQLNQPTQAVQPGAVTKAAQKTQAAGAPKPPMPTEEAHAILDQVRIKILDGKREARIQLRPIELGRIDLLVRVEGGSVTAKIAAESPEALAVLESHAPELRAWLARDGAESVDLQLSLLDPDNSDFAHADEGPGDSLGDRGASASGSGQHPTERPQSTPADTAALLNSLTRSVTEGGVDFVA